MKLHHKWNGLVPCCSFDLDYVSQTKGRLKHRLDEHCHDGKNEDACNSSITTHLLVLQPSFIFYKSLGSIFAFFFISYLNFHGAFYSSNNSNNLSNDFFSVSSLMPGNYFFLVLNCFGKPLKMWFLDSRDLKTCKSIKISILKIWPKNNTFSTYR